MSEAKVRGSVHLIEDTKTFGARGFRKRLVVLEQTSGRFTNYIPLEFTNDSCDSVNELQVGDEIEATYRLTGRKWQKDPSSEVKFFLSAEASSFRVVKGKSAGTQEIGSDFEAANEPPFDDNEPPF